MPIYDEMPLKKILVFNHRAHSYKNYPWVLKQLDILYQKRQDFKLWVPLAEKVDRDYIFTNKYDRRGYFSKLSGCYLGICAKQKYAGWAVSATDGLSVGLPYLFSDDLYYKELTGNNYDGFYKDDKDFQNKINQILDDTNMRNKLSEQGIKRYKSCIWPEAIKPFSTMFDSAINSLPILKTDTKSYKKIVNFIKKRGTCTKKDILEYINWGVGIPFSSYRNRLRSEPDIILSENGYYYK